jgi:transcriptional regulator
MFFDAYGQTRYPFPKPPPVSRTSMSKAQKEAIDRERHALALEMRKMGYSYDQIAEHFETSPASARGIVKLAMEHLIKEPGQEVIDLELQRLDQLWAVAATAAAGGDLDAITKCLAIQQRRAKYLGLDVPEKREVTGAAGGPLELVSNLKGMSDEDLATMKQLVLKSVG